MIHHPAFSRNPDLGQFAKKGNWANAWRFSPQRLPSIREIAEYLANAEEISFEALFGSAFFGARFIGEPAYINDIGVRCVNALRGVAAGIGFFEAFSKSIGASVVGKGLACAEIGMVNSWHTDGPIVLAPPAQSPLPPEALWQSISTSGLAANSSNRKAIEFVFNAPFLHWFALPLSDASDSSHMLNESLFRSAYQYAAATR